MKREPVTVPLKRIRSLGWEHWPSKRKKSSSMLVPGRSREKNTGSSRRPMSELQECIYLSRHESVKIQQYVGIKFGKDIANKIKHSKMETAVTHSEGTAFGLKEEMES